MYRRYYPRYDRPSEEAQRPMVTDISADPDSHLTVSPQPSNEMPLITEPEIIIPEKPVQRNRIHHTPPPAPSNSAISNNNAWINNFFRGFPNFRRDDIILLALVLILFLEGVQDEMLLLILIFLFFSGF